MTDIKQALQFNFLNKIKLSKPVVKQYNKKNVLITKNVIPCCKQLYQWKNYRKIVFSAGQHHTILLNVFCPYFFEKKNKLYYIFW